MLMTLRPSNTTFGILEKLLSISTMWLTFFAASLPEATLTAQSASFMARISFTPSPVIATVLPSDFIVLTKIAFCSGVTRPNTVYLLATEATSLSFSPSSEIYLSALETPTRRATSATVTGLSPEIIFMATSFSLNQRIVCAASSRMLSAIETMASGLSPEGSRSPASFPPECAIISTRSPIDAYWFMMRLIFSGMLCKTNSGAPMAMVPISSNVTAESFRFDENGRMAVALSVVLCPK